MLPIVDMSTGASYLTWIVICDSVKTCKYAFDNMSKRVRTFPLNAYKWYVKPLTPLSEREFVLPNDIANLPVA